MLRSKIWYKHLPGHAQLSKLSSGFRLIDDSFTSDDLVKSEEVDEVRTIYGLPSAE